MKTVLVNLPVEKRHREKLEQAGPGCRFLYPKAEELTKELVAEAEIVIGNVPAPLIAASPRLELLQLNSAGADAYIVPGALDAHTVLCNATGAYGKAVSEHAFAMTLMLQKKLQLYRDAQRQNLWSDFGTVTSMADATVIVVGFGDIGLRYGRMAKALGATVIGVRRREGACPEGIDRVVTEAELDALLPEADVVASFLPGNPRTRHFYDAARFSRMKRGAIFINCGRGSAVDSEALREALEHGPLSAAGIDVTEIEPLPEDSPLWQLDNLMLTPHISGFYHLPETFERVVDIAASNLSAWLKGEALRNVVDFETGYKKS